MNKSTKLFRKGAEKLIEISHDDMKQYDQEQAEEWFGVKGAMITPDTTITHSPQARAEAIRDAITQLKRIKITTVYPSEVLQFAAFIMGERPNNDNDK